MGCFGLRREDRGLKMRLKIGYAAALVIILLIPAAAWSEDNRVASLDFDLTDLQPVTREKTLASLDDDSWDTTDKALLVGCAALWYMDYQQTLQIVEDENRYELNPFLGENPSKDRVNMHFAGSFALNYFIADKLNSKNRKKYLSIMVMFESAVINHNVQVGIKF